MILNFGNNKDNEVLVIPFSADEEELSRNNNSFKTSLLFNIFFKLTGGVFEYDDVNIVYDAINYTVRINESITIQDLEPKKILKGG